MTRKRLTRIVLVCLGALLLLWVIDLAQVLYALRLHASQAQALLQKPGAVTGKLAEGCALVRGLRQDVGGVRRDLGGAIALAPALGWVPGLGGDLRAAPHLLTLADSLTRAGELACDALQPASAGSEIPPEGAPQTGDDDVASLLPTWLEQITAAQAQLEQANTALQQSQAALQRIDPQRLSPRLAKWVTPLQQNCLLLSVGLRALPALPDLLGAKQPRTFLIQALNEDELRPGGGFLTGVGEVHVQAGRISEIAFRDSYAVDDYSQPYPEPPEPLRRYMNLDLWVLRDSNWSPDFPTSVRQALPLYRPGYTLTVDGVIAIDQWAVQELVGAVGEIRLPDSTQPVTGATLMAFFREAWSPQGQEPGPEWWKQRKSFMGVLATAMLSRLGQGDVDWLRIAQTVIRLLDEKHLLVYLQEPRLAALLAERGWDGAMQPYGGTAQTGGDYVMLVDANLGYNKVNAVVQQSMVYSVALPAQGGVAQAEATVTYTHTAPAGIPCVAEVRYDPQYERMMQRCYWDYARLYVPRGSVLVRACTDVAGGCLPLPVPANLTLSGSGDTGVVSAEEAQEGPWRVWGGFFVLPTGTTQVRRYAWTTPQDVISWRGEQGTYTLWIRKQAGAHDSALTVRIELPPASTLQQAGPQPSAVEGDWLVYHTTLARDTRFRVTFRQRAR